MSTHTSAANALAGNQILPRRQTHARNPGASLGLTATQTGDLVQQLEVGLPYKAIQALAAASGLSVNLIASTLRIPERTLARRKAGGRLAPDESERLLRISTVFEKAVELFEGDAVGAVAWLTSPKRALGRETPLAYSRTELGARDVEDLIGRLEHGVFS
jgi:putative toxin-antitoxin system antitoxin component (TIGR02293 family)